ncbi:transporter [Niveibacterium sp.]|uniref:transporter n=1 Tax=Niveibacterium sp. TaxID=2017444 RepID=UPI0035B22CBB
MNARLRCLLRSGCVALPLFLLVDRAAWAQSMEPRNYSNAPQGMNFAIVGLGHSEGGVGFDPALPVKNPDLEVWTSILGYARIFELAGQTARVDLVLPYAWLSGTADYAGAAVSREQQGLGDAIVRTSYNLYGSPALSLPEFSAFRPDLIVGVSLEVVAPTGAYEPSKVVNLGGHRWVVKPEIGLSKTLGPFVLELAGGVTFYTANADYFGGIERKQDPLYSAQAHAVYNFAAGAWVSLSASYFQGGRTYLDGKAGNDLQENWRLGATVAMPLSRYQSVKLAVSDGVYARTGNNMSLVVLALQTRWGGGL